LLGAYEDINILLFSISRSFYKWNNLFMFILKTPDYQSSSGSADRTNCVSAEERMPMALRSEGRWDRRSRPIKSKYLSVVDLTHAIDGIVAREHEEARSGRWRWRYLEIVSFLAVHVSSPLSGVNVIPWTRQQS